MERTRVELVTSSMPLKRATNCANAPQTTDLFLYQKFPRLGNDWIELLYVLNPVCRQDFPLHSASRDVEPVMLTLDHLQTY